MSKSVKVKVKGKKGMIAIFMAIIIKVILSFVLVEYTENNIKQITTMKNAEDKIKAKYLALSGVNFAILFLEIQKGIDKMLDDPMIRQFTGGINFKIWEQVPISSDLIAMFADKDAVSSMLGADRYKELKDAQGDTEEKPEKEPALDDEGNPIVFERNFNFDGDFNAEISDESGKINVNLLKSRIYRGVTEKTLKQLFSQPNYTLFFEGERENETVIPPEEVVASMKDWIDLDDERSGLNGGSEDERYSYLKHKYHSKNMKLFSLDEFYMIYGIDDDFMEIFKDSLTVYGEKPNINTASPLLIEAFIRHYAKEMPPEYNMTDSMAMYQLVQEVLENIQKKPFKKPEEFTAFLKSKSEEIGPINPFGRTPFSTKSTIYKITSYGSVGEATSKVVVVVDTKDVGGNNGNDYEVKYKYYREE